MNVYSCVGIPATTLQNIVTISDITTVGGGASIVDNTPAVSADQAVVLSSVNVTMTPVSTSIPTILQQTVRIKEVVFSKTDWVMSPSRYYIEVVHNWGTLNLMYQIFDQVGKHVFVGSVQPYSLDKLRIFVPQEPDLRFNGLVFVYALANNPISLN